MCLPREAMDDNLLGADNVGALVVHKNCKMHMSFIRWPLPQTQLLNNWVLADIVELRAENMMSSSEDKLIGVSKAPCRCVWRKKSYDSKSSKFQRMILDEVVRKVSSLKCYIQRSCQRFVPEGTSPPPLQSLHRCATRRFCVLLSWRWPQLTNLAWTSCVYGEPLPDPSMEGFKLSGGIRLVVRKKEKGLLLCVARQDNGKGSPVFLKLNIGALSYTSRSPLKFFHRLTTSRTP